VSRLALIAAAALLNGCFASHYLAQAARGQIELLDKRRPIEAVLGDPAQPPHVRTLLAEVAGIKRFAEARGLKATRNYTRYVDLKRDAAVWVVSASAPLAMRPQTWWFPIVGRVPYLGWFRLADAQRFAFELQKKKLDVNLRPAAAYSTLGFFDDPILSTMLSKDRGALFELVNTILHESLHATFYVPQRTDLSESVASFVGDELTRDWIDERYGRGSAERARYDQADASGRARLQKMLAAKGALQRLYASELSDQEKLEQKGEILGRLRFELKTKRVINNATLMELSNYASGQEELGALLACTGRDWPKFLAALQAWAKTSKPSFETLAAECPRRRPPAYTPSGG
jgi:predicted aminopeptidase